MIPGVQRANILLFKRNLCTFVGIAIRFTFKTLLSPFHRERVLCKNGKRPLIVLLRYLDATDVVVLLHVTVIRFGSDMLRFVLKTG